ATCKAAPPAEKSAPTAEAAPSAENAAPSAEKAAPTVEKAAPPANGAAPSGPPAREATAAAAAPAAASGEVTDTAPDTSKSAREEPARGDGRTRASPMARHLAAEHGLDLGSISGSGPQGRVIRADIEAALSAKPG